MKKAASYFCSSIGRKQLVAVSGIGLTLFVLGHVTGNFLMFVGPEAYNRYGHGIVTNPLIYVIEAGLVSIFAAHLLIALKLQMENFLARPVRYAVVANGAKRTSITTRTLWLQGLVIAVFAVLHLITFKYGPAEAQGYQVTYNGVVMRDLFRLVHEVFQQPIYVVWYSVALLVLGFHLCHGVPSSLQSLGFHHPKYTACLKKIGAGLAIYVSLGFIAQPLYLYFFYR